MTKINILDLKEILDKELVDDDIQQKIFFKSLSKYFKIIRKSFKKEVAVAFIFNFKKNNEEELIFYSKKKIK